MPRRGAPREIQGQLGIENRRTGRGKGGLGTAARRHSQPKGQMDFLKKGVEAAKKAGTKAVNQFKEVLARPPACEDITPTESFDLGGV